MFKRLPTILISLALTAFLLGSAAMGGLLLWIANGPMRLTELTPSIEEAFKAKDGSYSVHVGETWLEWGSWDHPLDFRLHEVSVVASDGRVISAFPEVAIDISLWMLPLGKVLPTSITVSEPFISLVQNEDRSISLSLGEPVPATAEQQNTASAQPNIPFAAFIGFLSGKNSNLRKLEYFKVKKAKAAIGNARRGVIFEVTGVDITAQRDRDDNFRILIGGDMHYQNHQSAIGAEVIFGEGMPSIKAALMFEKLVPGALASLFADDPIFHIVNAPLSGKISASLSQQGVPEHIAFTITGGNGYIESSSLANSIPINALRADGTIASGGSEIQLGSFTVNMEKMLLYGKGKIQRKDGDTAVQAAVGLKDVRASDVGMFWPPSLSPMSREWITTNITEGAISEALATVNIQFGDLAKPILPKEAVDASITIADATIRYLPEHPPVTGVKGVIHVDGTSLSANITNAKLLKDSSVTTGKLDIEDLNADNPYIKIVMDGTATAKDAVHFLKLPRLEHAKRLSLSEDTAQGTATLHAALGFNFFAPTDADGKPQESDIMYDISAEMKDIAATNFLQKFDVKNANGSFTINNKELTFKGTSQVNGATASQAGITYKFTPEDGFDTFIDVTATAPIESLPRFGYPKFAFAKGSLGVKANVKLGDTKESSSATIDLANTALDVKELGWTKPDKIPATLDIKAEKQEGRVTIPSFTLTGNGLEAKGSAALDDSFTRIETVELAKIRLGETRLDNLLYDTADGKMVLAASGESLDLSGWLDSDDDSGFSFERFPAVQLSGNILKLRLSKQESISYFKGKLSCSKTRCESASITGQVGKDNKQFDFRILRNPKGKRQVSLHAVDAGAFLSAIGAFDNIEGGDLTMTGNYDDTVGNNSLGGRILVTNFTVKKAPVLAKILALASLTGPIDLLQGNGISFSKLAAPFTSKKDVVTFKKAKMYGGSIGLTADGTVTFPKRDLDLNGTVIPAYVVNNILGKVPIVGQLLTGGEGKGVFAFNYTVKGTGDNPEVSVNPLSILTPGFLRGIFEGGDNEE